MFENAFRILIPLDGTRLAESAIGAILPLARARRAEIILLHVRRPATDPEICRGYLEPQYQEVRALGLEAAFDLRSGKAAEEIVGYARDAGVDLIAMATHGRSGLSRIVAGSVTEEVLRHATVPVFVSRPREAGRAWDRVVVALDGSERAEQILPYAVTAARALKAMLDLVRVAIPLSVTPGGVGEVPFYIKPEDPLPYLKHVCAAIAPQGVRAGPVPLQGRAATEILNYLRDSGAGLLCMTTHGRGGLGRLVMGSVAEEVVRHSPCPVLIRRMMKSEQPAAQEA